MAELSEVGIASGVPNSGTGEVPTLAPVRDQLISANDLLELIEAVVTAVKDATSNAFKSLLVDATGAALAVDSTVRIEGNLPQGDADTTPFPLGMGAITVAHGANPTAQTAGARKALIANRAGALFVIGGHPNSLTRGGIITDANGAQTDAAISPAVSAGTKIVVTRFNVVCDNANTGDSAIIVGFGAATIPTADLDGADGVLVNGSFDGGAGIALGNGGGILAVGGDGEELRITCSDPAGGNIRYSYTYYTIES